MTIINFDLRRADGVTPAIGTILVSPSRRIHVDGVDDYVILPAPIARRLEDGTASIDLRPTDPSWAWRVQEKVQGGKTRYVVVPNSTTAIDYADLIDVDPKTLTPTAEPEAAWWVALEQIVLTGGDEALANHINSETPHPAYDLDIPSLTLTFENGLI